MKRIEKLRKLLGKNEGVMISSFANIFYYSGFTSEDATLFITHNRQILLTDSRYMHQASVEAKNFEIRNITEGLQKISECLDCEVLGFEENYVTVKEFSAAGKLSKKLVPMQEKISCARRVKDKFEIDKIRCAEELSVMAYEYTLENIKAGMTELDVAYMLETYMRKNGALKTSFDTIVASGIRSCMPHGVATDKVIEKGDFVTMDFGCVLDGYCSDMTRTVVIGKCSERQKEIYNTVLEAQNAALNEIAPGKRCSDIDKIARDIIEDRGYGDNFGHSLGHSVGIEIHEAPNFSPKSEDIAECGNVITVEPGIYIDGFGGVRIEDVVVIGKNTENLTKTSKDLIII